MPHFYAGVGSRSTPDSILKVMAHTAKLLRARNCIPRTGGAPGADLEFMREEPYELYLPWDGFNGHKKSTLPCPHSEAYIIAQQHHPAWNRLGASARALHARNSHQVLGPSLDSPSEFVLCWTPDGSEEITTPATGGTGQAIRIAAAYKIPIINMQRVDWSTKLDQILEVLNGEIFIPIQT